MKDHGRTTSRLSIERLYGRVGTVNLGVSMTWGAISAKVIGST